MHGNLGGTDFMVLDRVNVESIILQNFLKYNVSESAVLLSGEISWFGVDKEKYNNLPTIFNGTHNKFIAIILKTIQAVLYLCTFKCRN